MNSTAQQVIAVLAARVGKLPAAVGEGTRLAEIDLDSLTLLEVTFDLQTQFPDLDEAGVAAAVTVGDLIGAVTRARLPEELAVEA
jgi:acyl carrier protein